jgi:hypothetical protein
MSTDVEGVPSEEGKRRNPRDPVGYKWDDVDEVWRACTCTPECRIGCGGECGCVACRYSYMDEQSWDWG